MARRRGNRPGYRSLRRRYADVVGATYERLLRLFRSDVAKARKRGLLPPETNARRAVPTSALSRVLNRIADVLTGRKHARAVSDKQAKKLRKSGYQVEQNKVILSPEYNLDKKGNLVLRTGGRIRRVKSLDLRAHDLEEQVTKIFSQLKPGELVGFQLYGHTGNLYGDADLFLYSMLGYRDKQVKRVDVVYIPESQDYEYFREAEQRRQAGFKSARAQKRRLSKGVRMRARNKG